MQYKYRKKKKIKEKNELKREKWDVEKKSGVMKIEHYSKTCWSREEEARYLQLQMHKLRASKNTSVFQKHGKIHFESWPNSPVSHGVVWISYSRFFFFCSLTELAWCELPGSVVSGTALWSWWSSLFQTGEVVRWCCTWIWTCLAAFGCFWRHLCSEMDKVESQCSCSAPFPDFGLVISMMKNWFT